MQQMKALVLEAVHQAPTLKIVDKPQAGLGEVIVQLHAAALNHRDVYITEGLYPNIVTPVILGSDGAGIVTELGEGVDKQLQDKAVLINPSNNWGRNPRVQTANYHILGMPTNGCFAEYVCVKADRLVEKPSHLSFAQAAALPLGGQTAYRALFTRARLKAGERVLISGVGGGVAQLGLQMAIAIGAEVWVTSSSEEKIKLAIDIGAKGGINYNTKNWHKLLKNQLTEGFDVILDSAGGEGFKYFLDLANPAGRIVFYGGTRGKFQVNPQKIFWKQLDILGSTMGNDQDFDAMIDFLNTYKLSPIITQQWPLENGVEAFQYMKAGKQFGKIILQITP